MAPWFDQSGRDMRSLDEWERDDPHGRRSLDCFSCRLGSPLSSVC